MDLMMSVCDSLVVLDFGKVISRGSPREIQADPAVTAAYLGANGSDGE
jgi:branched-chain amino acid transport system ATP-binding protein